MRRLALLSLDLPTSKSASSQLHIQWTVVLCSLPHLTVKICWQEVSVAENHWLGKWEIILQLGETNPSINLITFHKMTHQIKYITTWEEPKFIWKNKLIYDSLFITYKTCYSHESEGGGCGLSEPFEALKIFSILSACHEKRWLSDGTVMQWLTCHLRATGIWVWTHWGPSMWSLNALPFQNTC